MNTRFELVVWGDEAGAFEHDAGRLRALAEEALDEVSSAERELSRFRRDSLLSHLHRQAAGQLARVPPDLFGLLLLCQAVWDASGGAFDPTVAPYSARLGLDVDAPALEATGAVGWSHVMLDADKCTVQFDAGVQLDLGGVAKGWALDQAAAVLRDAGIQRAFLHGGTSCGVSIGPPRGEPFRVLVRDPHGERPCAALSVRDGAFAVSAPHGKEVGGASHIVNPQSGDSARDVVLSAVMGDSAAVADAWSTALVAAGSARHAYDACPMDGALVQCADGRRWQRGARCRFLDGSTHRSVP